jgi:hypothetical protein
VDRRQWLAGRNRVARKGRDASSQMSRRRVLSVALGIVAVLVVPRLAKADDPQATIEALERELDEKDATVAALQTQVSALSPTSTPTPRASQTPETGPGSITQFGEQGALLFFDGNGIQQWRLTFDPNVEVRSFIGDYSIVPRRGQFLVMWFDQQAVSEEPLPLGNFELQVLEPESDEHITTYQMSKEATVALALTEFDWIPSLMQSDLSYRTGVVFDIKPEDVHFRLQYTSAGLRAGESKTWVDIEFTA